MMCTPVHQCKYQVENCENAGVEEMIELKRNPTHPDVENSDDSVYSVDVKIGRGTFTGSCLCEVSCIEHGGSI